MELINLSCNLAHILTTLFRSWPIDAELLFVSLGPVKMKSGKTLYCQISAERKSLYEYFISPCYWSE